MTDLETLIRASGADLHLQRPYAPIAQRGRALRRRRRGASAVVATALALGVGAAGLDRLSPDEAPLQVSVGRPSPPPAMVRLSPAQLTRAEEGCRAGMTLLPKRYDGLRVFAAANTSDGAVLLYRNTDQAYACTWVPRAQAAGGGGGAIPAMPGPGRELVSAAYRRSDVDGDGEGALVAYGRVDVSVTRVVGTVQGHQVEAALAGGWYWLWSRTQGGSVEPVPPIDLRAYDADGVLLSLTTAQW